MCMTLRSRSLARLRFVQLAFCFGLDVVDKHVIDKLIWYFLQDFLSEESYIVAIIIVPHKLDDISSLVLLRVHKVHVIRIQDLHILKVCVTNSDDYDADRIFTKFDNIIDGFFHVVDDSIGQDHQDVIHVHLHLVRCFYHLYLVFQYFAEKRWAPEFYAIQAFFIGFY